MATRMLQRRGTAAEWASQNPILAVGELGFETDTFVIKMGDGVTPWADLGLPYLPTAGGALTGPLSLPGAPVSGNHAVRKVDMDSGLLGTGLRRVIPYTSDTSFIKSNYPWLNSLVVDLVGGGGGGAGAGTQPGSSGSGGGGGAWSRTFIDDIPNLGSSIPIGIGARGNRSGGATDASDGGDTTFGAIARAEGGVGGKGRSSGQRVTGGRGGLASNSVGDIVISGEEGGAGWAEPSNEYFAVGGRGGSAAGPYGGFGGQQVVVTHSGTQGGDDATGYGGGGSGGVNDGGGNTTGGFGHEGFAVLHLYGGA